MSLCSHSLQSQPLTWAQAWCSCSAKYPLCPFWATAHAAILLWTSRTLPPSLLSSAPAPQAVVVCRSTGQHTWGVARASVHVSATLYDIYPDYAAECFCLLLFLLYLAALTLHYHTINIMFKAVTHTLMESCCVEEFLLSVEAEDIWGFTRAIEMVGGVSLVIFFSFCNGTDTEWSSSEIYYIKTTEIEAETVIWHLSGELWGLVTVTANAL